MGYQQLFSPCIETKTWFLDCQSHVLHLGSTQRRQIEVRGLVVVFGGNVDTPEASGRRTHPVHCLPYRNICCTQLAIQSEGQSAMLPSADQSRSQSLEILILLCTLFESFENMLSILGALLDVDKVSENWKTGTDNQA